jgi:hypothetical protein
MTFDFIKAQLASGQITANLVVPLAGWLPVLSFLAVIVLLLGSEPA